MPSEADAAPRPFGRTADLDLEFDAADRPALVTALLERCAGDGAAWWQRTVGERVAALLQVLALSEGGDALAATLRCEAPGCGERFEVELPYAALLALAGDDSPVPVAGADGTTALLRRPTGEDLRRWRARPPARAAMLEALCLEGRIGAHDEAAAAEALAAADPLVDFTVSCACAVCGTPAERPLDLEATVLQRLARRQRALLREVHTFATHYGWSEAEVLAVPPARRAAYLALIGEAS